jgi:hypothetical protein
LQPEARQSAGSFFVTIHGFSVGSLQMDGLIQSRGPEYEGFSAASSRHGEHARK